MTLSATIPPAYRLTADDWANLPDRAGYQEILEGDLIVTPSPSLRHQSISGALYSLLRAHVRGRDLGRAFVAPVGVKLAPDTVLEPDVVVVLAANPSPLRELYIDGSPDLVIEVLSPGSAGRDLVWKRAAYERAGVSEYWIVDPLAESVEVLALRAGRLERRGLFGKAEALVSPVLPGLELNLAEAFE